MSRTGTVGTSTQTKDTRISDDVKRGVEFDPRQKNPSKFSDKNGNPEKTKTKTNSTPSTPPISPNADRALLANLVPDTKPIIVPMAPSAPENVSPKPVSVPAKKLGVTVNVFKDGNLTTTGLRYDTTLSKELNLTAAARITAPDGSPNLQFRESVKLTYNLNGGSTKTGGASVAAGVRLLQIPNTQTTGTKVFGSVAYKATDKVTLESSAYTSRTVSPTSGTTSTSIAGGVNYQITPELNVRGRVAILNRSPDGGASASGTTTSLVAGYKVSKNATVTGGINLNNNVSYAGAGDTFSADPFNDDIPSVVTGAKGNKPTYFVGTEINLSEDTKVKARLVTNFKDTNNFAVGIEKSF